MAINKRTAFEPARESLEWALKAIEDLEGHIRGFFTKDAGRFEERINTIRGCKELFFAFDKPVPSSLRRSATEALNNIKHSFDQSIYAANAVVTGKETKVNFPWRDNLTAFEHKLTREIPEQLWAALRKVEPYPEGGEYTGGNSKIRALATLANRKHDIGLQPAGQILQMEWPNVRGRGPVELLIPNWNYERSEILYARVPIDAHLDNNERVNMHIAIVEPGPLFGANLKRSLREFLAVAEAAHRGLKAACK